MASCWKYRDAWKPFFTLLRKFWPSHPEVHLLSDWEKDSDIPQDHVVGLGLPGVTAHWDLNSELTSYGPRLARFARTYRDEPILLLQEDFFIHAPVKNEVIKEAISLLRWNNAICVRLYPCPGSDINSGNAHYGFVSRGSAYRISLQASIWQPEFLATFGDHCWRPVDMEIHGTIFAEAWPNPVLAARRDVEPWPIQYLCSAISRGKWNPDAKRLCDQYGIVNDWTMRPFAA